MARAAEVGELVASASREMMHDDGKGCLEDLNRIRELDPKMDERMAVTRGQCEMLVGRCQEGKRRVAAWYVRETNMTKERADLTAESLGSMRCRAGNSTNRDEVLRALFELSDGAYMNTRTPEFCEARIKKVREIVPKLQPRDLETDKQIEGGHQALFHTGAACYARAGDCKAAYKVYWDLFPGDLSQVDQKMHESIVRESFESSIERCKGK